MSMYDNLYGELCNAVLEKGIWDKDMDVRPVWESDGKPAHTISLRRLGFTLHNDEHGEVPLLSQKHVAWKTSLKELIQWMWQEKSNSVDRLNELGVHIWDQWRLPDGTIGKAYGYQLGKKKKKVEVTNALKGMISTGYLSDFDLSPDGNLEYVYLDQVDYLLYQLKVDPASRRHIVMLWNWDDIDGMALTSCVYETQWFVQEGKLHMYVGIRSNDLALGNPFNVFQYYVLQRLIAQVTGLEMGESDFDIRNPHIYERHVEGIKHQLSLPKHPAPTLWINPEIKSFYDFTMDDIKLENYKWEEKIKFEVSV